MAEVQEYLYVTRVTLSHKRVKHLAIIEFGFRWIKMKNSADLGGCYEGLGGQQPP